MHRCLEALNAQLDPPRMEVLVPYDRSAIPPPNLMAQFPNVSFLDMGAVPTKRSLATEAGRHELYDFRRATGLGAATGQLLAILEDRGVPSNTWARTVVRLHDQPSAVIGGAIECGDRSLIKWAVYVCDFGRYSPPFDAGMVSWVSDINVSYKRRAIEATRGSWSTGFHEPLVHRELLAAGETLYLSPEMIVEHHRGITPLSVLLAERFHWGRLFGALRTAKLGRSKRMAHILAGPLLPLLLLFRHGGMQTRKGRISRFVIASPIMLLLLTAWSIGEVAGYLTGEG